MKLCFPEPTHGAQGGSATFRQNWLAWLDAQGIPHTTNLADAYDVLFVNAWQTPYIAIHRQKRARPDLRVVQRVDGAGRDYGRTDMADALQQAVNTLADVTIFQSHYSRRSTRDMYHIIAQDGPVIHNPVDTTRFTPHGAPHPQLGPPPETPRLLTAIWSDNPRKGAPRLLELARANPALEFIHIGHPLPEPPPNLTHFAHLDHAELAAAMRSAHIFLNLSENDPCPNVVLEALASGLPVIYAPSGGTPELVGSAAGLALGDEDHLADSVAQLMADWAAYHTAARCRAEAEFSFERIFSQYHQAIRAGVRRPLPTWWRHWFSRGQRARVWLWDKWQHIS
ncbi:MAG: glycosyltransferase family 4 protein [Anaerolineales bacterium]